MEMKNKLVVTGLIAGLAIFGAALPATAQTCQEQKGELHEISVSGSQLISSTNLEDAVRSEVKNVNLIRLYERSRMICSGEKFCIDEANIKNEETITNSFVVVLSIKTSAVMKCLD